MEEERPDEMEVAEKET